MQRMGLNGPNAKQIVLWGWIKVPTALEYEGIFGNGSYEQRLMPVVSVSKVTLENNSVTPPKSDNPHIVDYQVKTDEQRAVLYRQGTPQKNSSGKGCLATIDLIVRDMIESTELSSWFYDAELLKYMHIRVIQSSDEVLTNRLINGDMASLQEKKNLSLYKEKVLSLEKHYESTKEFYSSAESGRGSVADITYETSFQLADSQPQHLSYFAFCFFDIKELIQDYNLSLYGYNKKHGIISKNITSEIVIRKGEVVSEAYVFYTPSGKIWTGSVHKNAGIWMAGAKHSNRPHIILTRETVINSKIQDFRDIDEPLEHSINLQPIEAAIKRLGQKTSATEIKLEDKMAYLTEAFMSSDLVDSKRRCSFTFSFDYREFFKQNSEFGKLFESLKDAQVMQEILQRSNILSLKIYRNRAEDSVSYNRLGSPVRGAIFKENSYTGSQKAPVLVIKSSDVRGILQSKKSAIGSIREVQLKNASNLRTFMVTDAEVGEQTGGLYQYTAELKIQDGSIDYLKSQFLEFTKSVKNFESYNNICSTSDYYDHKSKSFTDGLQRHYDITQRSRNSSVNPGKYPWVEAPARFCFLLGLLSGTSAVKTQTMCRKLYGLSNATSGTPAGVSAVLSLMSKVEDILANLLGDKKGVSVDVSEKSGKTSSFEKFILTDRQVFSSLYNAETPHKYGINFLDLANRNDYSGPFTITVGDYMARLEQENGKYFVNDSPKMAPLGTGAGAVPVAEFGDVLTYGATYLSPSVAYAGSDSLRSLPGAEMESNISSYTRFGTSALIAMQGSESEIRPGQSELANRNFLGLQGVSLPSWDVRGAESLGLDDLRPKLGEESPFAQAEIDYSNAPTVPPESQGIQNLAAIFGMDAALTHGYEEGAGANSQISIECFSIAGDSCGIYGRYIDSGTQSTDLERIRQIPNQIKSLFFSQDSEISKTNWFDRRNDVAKSFKTAMMFIWNYQIISKVEYLSGFARGGSSEGSQLSSPVWKPLTYVALEALKKENSIMLCRMAEYTDGVYKIGHSSFSKMPYYNAYFHIASNSTIAGRIKKRQPRRKKRASAYKMLLNVGILLGASQLNVPRNVLKTVLKQKKPKNGSGDVLAPNKNIPDQLIISNSIDLLLDEAGGCCTAAIPRPPEQFRLPQQDASQREQGPADEQEYIDPPIIVIGATLFAGGAPGQDDSFIFVSPDKPSPGALATIPPPAAPPDYGLQAEKDHDRIVKKFQDRMKASGPTQKDAPSEPKIEDPQKRNLLLEQYVDMVYDIPGKPPEGEGTPPPGGDDSQAKSKDGDSGTGTGGKN